MLLYWSHHTVSLSLSLSQVGQCVVVFSQAPSGRAPLSPSLNSRPSPISSTPAPLGPDLRSQSPVRGAVEEAPCVNGRWGTLRPRASARASPSRGPDSPPLLNGSSPSTSPVQAASPPTRDSWDGSPSTEPPRF